MIDARGSKNVGSRAPARLGLQGPGGEDETPHFGVYVSERVADWGGDSASSPRLLSGLVTRFLLTSQNYLNEGLGPPILRI